MRAVTLSVSMLALLASGQVYAADMYRAPEGAGGFKDGYVQDSAWNGFYVGVNGGYGWNAGTIAKNIEDTYSGGTVTIPVSKAEPAGGFGGGQIGYSWQRDTIVFGVEADIQAAGISGKTSTAFGGGTANGLLPYDYASKYTLDYFGTVRGRLGYAADQTLIYATGGFAYGGVNYQGDAVFIGGTHAFSLDKSGTRTGYVVGAGAEQKLSPNWSVKAEYQYINLGTESATGIYPLYPAWSNKTALGSDFHTVRIGVDYHIGSSFEPLK